VKALFILFEKTKISNTMVREIVQQSPEHEEPSSDCRCVSDLNLFLGKLGDGDSDSDDKSEPKTTSPVHLGHFGGFDVDDNTSTSSVPQCSIRSLTTGSLEDDQGIISGLLKAASSRLRRECIDENLIASIEESGTVGWLKHSQIEIGDMLGVGSFSSVFDVAPLKKKDRDRLTKDIGQSLPNGLVIKILKPSLVKRPSSLSMCAADLVKEGAILALLGRHQNLVSLVAWTPTGLGGFVDNSCGVRFDSFFLVMDRLEETLKERLEEWRSEKAMRKKLPERFQIMTDLANAVKHVHSKDVIHRDLKPNNIGFDAQGTLKLFDFDVSRIIPKDAKPKASSSGKPEDVTFRLTQHVGTQRYMSPECARGEPYNTKSDVYAFGLVCHEILSLKIPYNHFRRSEEHYRSVFLAHERPSLPWKWPKNLRHFINNCWSHSIPNRPTMEMAYEFLLEESEMIVSCMEKKKKKGRSNSVKAVLDSFQDSFRDDSSETKTSKPKSRKIFWQRKFASDPITNADHKHRIAMETASTAKEDSSLTGSCFLR